MKVLFDIIISFWDTTENFLVNWAILGLVYPVAYAIAYKFTGKAAPVVGNKAKRMKSVHWTSRLFIYIGFIYLLKVLIWIVSKPLIWFNVEEPRFIASIVVAFLFLIFAIYVKIKSRLGYKIFKP